MDALLPPVDPRTADPAAAEALSRAREMFKGGTPNLARVMANSSATLHGYLDLPGALDEGLLEPQVRERIALLVAEQNGCVYCVSAHTYISKRALHMADDEIAAAGRVGSSDPRVQVLLELTPAINLGRGHVDHRIVEATRTAGSSDGEITEVVPLVATNAFTNYFAKAARVDIDFPRASPGRSAA